LEDLVVALVPLRPGHSVVLKGGARGERQRGNNWKERQGILSPAAEGLVWVDRGCEHDRIGW
jgi:hypothetical protein